jgi:RNA ligase (TIGR02306 family)
MSSLIVKVSKIEYIRPHPNADRLEVAGIDGWETIVSKGAHKVGDLVTFVPPEAIIPTDLADKLGFRQYLRGTLHNRVGLTKFRGVVSYGLVLPFPSVDILGVSTGSVPVEGDDVATYWGITKYEPPVRPMQGTPREKDLTFPEYIEIENFKHFKDCFQPGEMVYITEKIDGTNCRTGIETGGLRDKLKAGSHRVNRENPGIDKWAQYPYWFPHTLPGIRCALNDFAESCIEEPPQRLTIYGEVFGAVQGGVKSMNYGSPDKFQYRAFAAMQDDTWKKPEQFFSICQKFGIPHVPILYQGPYDRERLFGIFNQKSIVAVEYGKEQIMEGVIVQSAECPLKILKLINPNYLLKKQQAEDKGETFDVKDE